MNWLKKLFAMEQPQETKPKEQPINKQCYLDINWTFMEDGQAKMVTDWDEKFIKTLRQKGFNGSSEEAVVQKFMSYIYMNGFPTDGEESDYK